MCFTLEYFVKGNVIYQVDIPSLVRTSGLLAANLYILAPFLQKGAQYYPKLGNTVHLYMPGSVGYFSFF
jgi:hypothetical protein